MTAAELAGLVAAGEVRAVEVAQAHLDRIAAVDASVHAFLHVDTEGALAAARGRRRRAGRPARLLGPLAGVPLAMKDVVVTKGLPTTAGLEDPRGLAPAVRRDDHHAAIKDAGIVMLGKTNMDEFAMGSSTENSAYGPTRNPWDLVAHPGRLVRRLVGGGRRLRGAAVDRHRHRRLDPPARRGHRHRRAQAHLRRACRATA